MDLSKITTLEDRLHEEMDSILKSTLDNYKSVLDVIKANSSFWLKGMNSSVLTNRVDGMKHAPLEEEEFV